MWILSIKYVKYISNYNILWHASDNDNKNSWYDFLILTSLTNNRLYKIYEQIINVRYFTSKRKKNKTKIPYDKNSLAAK